MRCLAFIVAFIALSVGAFGQFGGGRGAGPGTNRTIAANEVGPAQISDRVFTTTVSGRLSPENTVSHSAAVGGIVSDVRVSVGQRVAVGDVLYTISRTDTSGTYAPVVVAARIAGTVTTVSVRPNNEIRSGEAGVSIIRTDQYVMDAYISDKDAFSVQVGEAVEGRTDDGAVVRGRLVSRSPEPDYQTGLFTLSFRFDGTASVYPGAFVSVDLPVETVRAIFIPQNLLFRRYGRYYIWAVSAQDKLTAREVTPGRAYGDDIQITNGLQAGDRILLKRRGNEGEGAPVASGKS